MKILYNKKRHKYELFQGIFWILLFVLGILFSDRKNVFFYLYLIMGLIHIYLHLKVKHYLSIENNIKQIIFTLLSTVKNFHSSLFLGFCFYQKY